jgi:hypothetical protein
MLELEIKAAYEFGRQQGGRPAILPVRVANHEPFRYPLNLYLDRLNWAAWEQPEQTPQLVNELTRAIEGGHLGAASPDAQQQLRNSTGSGGLVQPLPAAEPFRLTSLELELPGGTMESQSRFYIERDSDNRALEAIRRPGITITLKGPRQMGKSSLLNRIVEAAYASGKRIALLDFQQFGRSALADADLFFSQFCSWLSDQLELEDRVEEHWQKPLGNNQRCTSYVGRYLLPQLGQPLLVAMDEVETVFDTDFRSDFFGMLRSWHNSRLAISPIWKKLDLALVTSTEPYQLINNLNQSPFNVGEVIDLVDFTEQQVSDLNQRHGSMLDPADELQLFGLLRGHPYLIRRALYLLASSQLTPRELFSTATEDYGPFGDHLRYHLFRLTEQPELVRGLLQAIRNGAPPERTVFFKLRGAGLVRREGRSVLPRCQLYAEYFGERLRG